MSNEKRTLLYFRLFYLLHKLQHEPHSHLRKSPLSGLKRSGFVVNKELCFFFLQNENANQISADRITNI